MADDNRHDMTALRAALFDALRAVRAGTLEVAQARVINDLAGTLVDTARVEVDYVRATDAAGTGFLEPPQPQVPGNGIVGIRRHLLKDA